jgi:hypothetical protein
LYTWDFLETAEPVFSTSSKSEFLRWLELWPWLGTGERRAAPTHPEPDAVELDFENLAADHRTVFRWSKAAERRAVVPISIEILRGGLSSTETANAPAHL